MILTYPMSRPILNSGLVLEDLPDTKNWLIKLLSATFNGIQVSHAATCQQALLQLKLQLPDIALIDIGLPDGSGIDIIRQIKSRSASCLCVVSTVYDDNDNIFAALRAGADGYLLKDQPRQELQNLLCGITEGRPPLSPSIARRILQFFQNTHTQDEPHGLTPRETEVLQCIAKGYTVARTAELNGITYNTAASYVKNIYRKLNISSRAEAATVASRLGILSDKTS